MEGSTLTSVCRMKHKHYKKPQNKKTSLKTIRINKIAINSLVHVNMKIEMAVMDAFKGRNNLRSDIWIPSSVVVSWLTVGR